MSSSTSENHVCTDSTCADGDDMQKIKCNKCKGMVHYYVQIFQFTNYSYSLQRTTGHSFVQNVLTYQKN